MHYVLDGYLEHDQGCYIHKCPDGYIANDDDKCVECDGPCPRNCDWRYLENMETTWITASFLRNESNHNCTKIIGNVDLVSGSWERSISRVANHTIIISYIKNIKKHKKSHLLESLSTDVEH